VQEDIALPENTINATCAHCGDACQGNEILLFEKSFCCSGCSTVYSILHRHDLENYYCLDKTPGSKGKESDPSKFLFLDDDTFASKLIHFKNDTQTHVTLYLPQIHCSSCLWLLEHLSRLHDGILSSRVNFTDKKVTISFLHHSLSLKELAGLLSSIGYEPFISLQDYEEEKQDPSNRSSMIKLGIAGFCFANIMLISLPEYFGLSIKELPFLTNSLRYIALLLALPVFFYAASEFFLNAWNSLKQRFITIDAPIALAILVTFSRSLAEILSGSGSGYLDSMSGIVFFMLIGRKLQARTAAGLKFNRDFRSYFPVSVTQVKNGQQQLVRIQDIAEGDLLFLHHQEIVPVDCFLSSRDVTIDYSFVTGESDPITMQTGELIYAGGKITSAGIEVLVVRPFSGNSFTTLWNNPIFRKKKEKKYDYIEKISHYFSLVLLFIASLSFVYWQFTDPSNAWNAFTAVLIVACPCTLLLASTYTYGFLIELFSEQGLFVRNAETISSMGMVDHIVFDKTGTLTEVNKKTVVWKGDVLSEQELCLILSVLRHSTHPLSKAISSFYANKKLTTVTHLRETPGKGIEAWLQEEHIKTGSAAFTNLDKHSEETGSVVHASYGKKTGYFLLSSDIKPGIASMIKTLKQYTTSLLSGDNANSYQIMEKLFPSRAALLYTQTPQMKLDYIKQLQKKNEKVLMIGDGINDAGALKQSDVGIAVMHQQFTFSPASDAILQEAAIAKLDRFLNASKQGRKLIIALFVYSLLYNLIGLSFAVTAQLKPVIAAILMPASSITVILIAYAGTRLIARKLFDK